MTNSNSIYIIPVSDFITTSHATNTFLFDVSLFHFTTAVTATTTTTVITTISPLSLRLHYTVTTARCYHEYHFSILYIATTVPFLSTGERGALLHI